MTTDQKSSQSHLSADLEMLHARVKGKSLTLAELKQSLKGRGPAMLLILLALPFCFIAIPGLSTPFGIAIVRVTWSFNCSSYLGFYRSDLCVRHWRFPEAFGFFSGLMRLDFITALTSPSSGLHIATAMRCLPWPRNTLPPFYKLGFHEIR